MKKSFLYLTTVIMLSACSAYDDDPVKYENPGVMGCYVGGGDTLIITNNEMIVGNIRSKIDMEMKKIGPVIETLIYPILKDGRTQYSIDKNGRIWNISFYNSIPEVSVYRSDNMKLSFKKSNSLDCSGQFR